MDRLKESLERHGLELRSDKCTAYGPTPERADGVREEMTPFVKWTPNGLMILGTASDGEYRRGITTGPRINHEPTSGRLQSARIVAGKIRQMCEADLECRRLAPAWKLVTIVLNNALPFDCCVVPPEALGSYAQEVDEIVDALLPLFVGQDPLEHVSIERMRLSRNAGGFDATSALLRSPMAFLAQYLAIASSVANASGVRAMETLRLVEAARDAQESLRRMGQSIDERNMPREEDSPSREMNVARVGNQALRKRQASWKQPLAEAATRSEPLIDSAARLSQLGGDENALWLTTNEGPECASLDDMEFRINARVRLDLPVTQRGLCQHQRRQKSDGTPGARCFAHLDEQGQHAQRCLMGGDRAKLHDVGCHIIHNACCEAGLKSQREVVVPALATEELTEPRFDVDAWGHPGLPHMRLDLTVVDAEALHYSSVMGKAQEQAPAAAQAEKAKENKYGKTKGGIGVMGIAMQLSGRFGPGLDTLLRKLAGYKRAITKAAGKDSGRLLQEWRKLLSVALARYTAATMLSAAGHQALRGK